VSCSLPCVNPTPASTSELSPELHKELIEVALAYQELEPWQACYDTDLVGLIDEQSGAVRLASVLGNAGEVFGLSIYHGKPGVRWIWNMAFGEEDESRLAPDLMYCMQAWKLEFVPAKDLTAANQDALKKAGYKIDRRSSRLAPEFLSLLPGTFPDALSEAEGRLLLSDLRKLVAFFQLLEEDIELLDGGGDEEVLFLPARPLTPEEPLRAEELQWLPLTLPPVPPPEVAPFDLAEKDRLLALRPAENVRAELDVLHCPLPIAPEGRRAGFPLMALMVDASSGLVLGMAMDDTWSANPAHVLRTALVGLLEKLEALPVQIRYRRSELAGILGELQAVTGVQTKPLDHLPMVNEFYLALQERTLGGAT